MKGPFSILPREWWVLLLLTCLLLGAALSSPVWYDDAGHYLVVEQGLESGQLCHPLDLAEGRCDTDSPFITLGPAVAWASVAWMGLFGKSMVGMRILFCLFSIGFLAVLYRFVRFHFGREKAIWTLLLFGINIQFLTYGAMVLGEIPMMLGVWGAVAAWWSLPQWRDGQRGVLTAVAVAFGLLAKAYLVIPLGIGLAGWCIWLAVRRQWNELGQTVLWWGLGTGLAAGLQLWFWGGWGERSSYTSEFMVFELGESLRFLAFKPLYALGTFAVVLRLLFEATRRDVFLACLHLGWTLFFLASAGFDRFGFQLLVVPAIYLAEFLSALWKKWEVRWHWRWVGAVVFVLVFAQKTPYQIGHRLMHPELQNADERAVAKRLGELGVERIYTFDQQMILFLPEAIGYRLPEVVPSFSEKCTPLALQEGEWLVAGPYSNTEYPGCVNWDTLEQVGAHMGPYSLWRNKQLTPKTIRQLRWW